MRDAADAMTGALQSAPACPQAPVVPEGAIYNPQNATGDLHLGIDVGSTTVKLAVLNDATRSSTPSTSATTPTCAPALATCSWALPACWAMPA